MARAACSVSRSTRSSGRSNNFVYLYYTTASGMKLARYRFRGSRLRRDRVILGRIAAGPIHDSGRIAFGPDGRLYVATGDAGNESLPQRPRSRNGDSWLRSRPTARPWPPPAPPSSPGAGRPGRATISSPRSSASTSGGSRSRPRPGHRPARALPGPLRARAHGGGGPERRGLRAHQQPGRPRRPHSRRRPHPALPSASPARLMRRKNRLGLGTRPGPTPPLADTSARRRRRRRGRVIRRIT